MLAVRHLVGTLIQKIRTMETDSTKCAMLEILGMLKQTIREDLSALSKIRLHPYTILILSWAEAA